MFWLSVIGYKPSNKLLNLLFNAFTWTRHKIAKLDTIKHAAIGFRFEFCEMCVYEENGDENWFMPNRFALRRISKDDNILGRAFIELLIKNDIECRFHNLKEFCGFNIINSDINFSRENLRNKDITCLVANEVNKKHPDYFEFSVIFNYPKFKITMQEVDPLNREKLFNHLFEKTISEPK